VVLITRALQIFDVKTFYIKSMKRYIYSAIVNLGDEPREVRYEVAKNPNTRLDELSQLAQETDPFVLGGLISNPNLPREIYEQLANSRLSNVRYGLANSLYTPSDILEQLSLDEDWEVRVAVADNPNTPSDVLFSLSREGSAAMAFNLARNPSTPSYILGDLIGLGNDVEDNCYICFELLDNPNVTPELIRKIATFANGVYLQNETSMCRPLLNAIIDHPKTPADIREYAEALR